MNKHRYRIDSLVPGMEDSVTVEPIGNEWLKTDPTLYFESEQTLEFISNNPVIIAVSVKEELDSPDASYGEKYSKAIIWLTGEQAIELAAYLSATVAAAKKEHEGIEFS